jgi:sugar-phosphatase
MLTVGADLMQLECDAFLFDLDGTLVDSTEAVVRQWACFAMRHGLALEDILAICHGRRAEDTIRTLTPHLDVEAEALRHLQGEIEDTEGVVAIPGAARLLAGLPRNRWAIVTACNRPLAEARIRAGGLLRNSVELPEVMITAEQICKGKPDPEGYLKAAEALGIAPHRCVVFEDAPFGIEAGLAAGMAVIGLATTFSPEQLQATVCVKDLEAVQIEAKPEGGFRICIASIA